MNDIETYKPTIQKWLENPKDSTDLIRAYEHYFQTTSKVNAAISSFAPGELTKEEAEQLLKNPKLAPQMILSAIERAQRGEFAASLCQEEPCEVATGQPIKEGLANGTIFEKNGLYYYPNERLVPTYRPFKEEAIFQIAGIGQHFQAPITCRVYFPNRACSSAMVEPVRMATSFSGSTR